MKESILDVLLYLFEHYFAEDAAPPLGDLANEGGDAPTADLKALLAHGHLVDRHLQAGTLHLLHGQIFGLSPPRQGAQAVDHHAEPRTPSSTRRVSR